MILFNLLAKGVILLGFLLAGPYLLKQFSLNYTDDRLAEKREQVLVIIQDEGIESFFYGGESGYGSYNILKEEYISLEKVADSVVQDSIFNEERIIEDEIVSYRVLAFTFTVDNTTYLLEIGRSLDTIQQIERVISTFIYIAFTAFIILSLFLDTTFHSILLRPFHKIIYDKLPEIKEPQQYAYKPIETRTTDFKILDEAIRDMMTRIQQVFNREREFIAHASHELRTPISVLQSKIENMLTDTELNEQDVQRLMDMQLTIQRFKHLVNSLLLISKISNAQFIKNEEVDLILLVHELAEEWGPVAGEKGLHFSVHAESPARIRNSNYSMVTMMIQNALINSIRYTPDKGSIQVTVQDMNTLVMVEVKDTGPGIKPELLEQVNRGMVFLKDAKSDKSGFGLQIMHKIAAYLDVTLTIDSDSTGTTIRFMFPATKG